MIKINPLDAHDRLQHFTKQSFSISECCQDLIKQEPFGRRPFYIFAHARTDEDGVTKRLIWQPRLSKPKAQTNSMLFKAYPGSDSIKVIWMIPAREMWMQFEKGKLTENKTVCDSIHSFLNNREALEMPEDDDPNEEQMKSIYNEVASLAKYDKKMKSLYSASLKKSTNILNDLLP